MTEEIPLTTYTDGEVAKIMMDLQQIYALDDAIYNQEQLRRPETFVSPLKEIRAIAAKRLTDATNKTPPKELEKPQ